MMTPGPQRREEWREQAIELGREQAIELGRRWLLSILLGLLRQRFGAEMTPALEQCVAGGSFEQLETWTSQVVSAATLAELLGDWPTELRDQQLIEQGRQQGIEQVRQRFAQTLLRQLRQHFWRAVPPAIEQRIAGASVEQLETWASRVIPAATLAELLGD